MGQNSCETSSVNGKNYRLEECFEKETWIFDAKLYIISPAPATFWHHQLADVSQKLQCMQKYVATMQPQLHQYPNSVFFTNVFQYFLNSGNFLGIREIS